MSTDRLTRFISVLVILLMMTGTGCRKQKADAAAGPAPVQVIVVEAKTEPVAESLSLTASITPNETVEIKSETDGIVLETRFTEGEQVAKGRVLVQLDDSKFAA